MPKKYYLILAVVVVVVGALIFWIIQPKKTEAPADETVYYYGKDCSHCQNVEKFLEENNIADKIKFSEKEVQYNKNNAEEFMRRAEACNIKDSNLGVPFVYSEGKCYAGEPEVTDFFKKAAGLN